ncbi:MAG: lysylphosphatidylglycerol synthase transmembrane domain-containing protein [Bacteroidota bacterium]|nr:lysylphosphatidylglycerol synthase transmembrane domain-containing protein [Bacteroidota bacterium]
MKLFLKVFKYLLFLSFGVLIFWLVYRKQPVEDILEGLKTANYSWIIIALSIALTGHLSRAMRWKIIIKPLGKNIRTLNSFVAVMIGYLANLALPRMGEVTKCVILNRTDKLPINKLLGTVLVERVVDFIGLLILTFIAVVIEFSKIKDILYNSYHYYKEQYENLFSYTSIGLAIFIIVAFIATLILIKKSKRNFKQHPLYLKIRELIAGFWSGIKTIKKMDRRGAFIFHTVYIWVTYFLMTYLVFFSIEATSHLDAAAGLFVLTIGSLGFIMPVQGGIGTYHFAAEKALKVFNIGHEDASLFALIAHSSQTIMIILVGGISFMIFYFIQRNAKHGQLSKN